ncbi:unnamed protein product, partial [Rotaria socialis]
NQVHPQSSVSKKSNGDEKNQRSQPATDSAGELDFQSSGSKKSNGDENQRSQSATDSACEFDFQSSSSEKSNGDENQRSQSATDSAGEFDFQSSGSEKSNGDENQRSQSATDSASEFDPEEILFADVSNYESNIEHNINIESEFDESDEYDNTDKTDIDSQELFGVLTQLLTRSTHDKVLPVAREAETGCPPGEMFVEYIYEHDIYNQVFNSALQYRSSPVLLSLQSDINDWIVEEIYKHNLAADVNDPVRILRIVDISKEYNNNPAVRYYVSLVIRKTQIPIIRRVFALIFDKLQRQYFSTPNSECPSNDQKPTEYRLEYEAVGHQVEESIDELNEYLILLCKTSAKLAQFLMKTSQMQHDDSIVSEIDRMIDEENVISQGETPRDLNKKLMEKLKQLKTNYQKQKNQTERNQSISDLAEIYNLLNLLKGIPMVNIQLDAIKNYQQTLLESNQRHISTTKIK